MNRYVWHGWMVNSFLRRKNKKQNERAYVYTKQKQKRTYVVTIKQNKIYMYIIKTTTRVDTMNEPVDGSRSGAEGEGNGNKSPAVLDYNIIRGNNNMQIIL